MAPLSASCTSAHSLVRWSGTSQYEPDWTVGLLPIPLHEVANQRQEARYGFVLVNEAVHISQAFGWFPRVQDNRHLALDSLHLFRKKRAGRCPQHVIGKDKADRGLAQNFHCLCARGRAENGVTSLLQHGLPQAQIDLVILDAQNQGLACGLELGGGHVFKARLFKRFSVLEQDTRRKFSKHCMASNGSVPDV
jgi:hypothetical protein